MRDLRPTARPTARDDALDLLRVEVQALTAEVHALRNALRKRPDAPDLIAAIGTYFGSSRFTARMVLELVDDPVGGIADALAGLIDLESTDRSKAVALGLLLKNLPGVETVAPSRGCAVYRLRLRN